jgi:hypothetical protein
MARHVNIVSSEAFDGDTEAGNKLAKKIYDVVNGATLVGITAIKNGRDTAVIIVTDTT